MNLSLQKNDNLTGLISIELDVVDYNPNVEKALKTAQKRVQMPGFRPGHVPMGLVKKMYGKSILAEEVNEISSKKLMEYVEGEKLNLLGSPLPSESKDFEGSFDAPGKFIFHYDVAFAPDFELKLDKSKKYEQKMVKITDEVLNEEVDKLARRYGTMTDVLRPESDTDMLFVELYEVDADGNKNDMGYVRETFLSLQSVSDQATKDALYGLSVDSTLVVESKNLSGNENDAAYLFGVDKEQLADIPTVLTLKLTKVRQNSKAELNAEFFEKHYPDGSVKSEEDLRAQFSKQIAGYYDNMSDQMLYYAVQKDLIEHTPIVLPIEFLRRWLLAVDKEITEDKLNSDFQRYANGIKWELIEGKLVSQYGIQYNMDELNNAIRKNIRERFMQYGIANIDDETVDKVLQQEMKDQKALKAHQDRVLDAKVLEVVKANCTIDIAEVPEEEFFAVA
jgi:trigger factor